MLRFLRLFQRTSLHPYVRRAALAVVMVTILVVCFQHKTAVYVTTRRSVQLAYPSTKETAPVTSPGTTVATLPPLEEDTAPESTPGCYFERFCMKYLLKPRDFCSDRHRIKLLVFVSSYMSNFARRQHVRATWGNKTLFSTLDVRVVFMLGRGKDFYQSQGLLLQEAMKYNDLVVGDFLDTYENMTLKSILGLHWTSTFCPNTYFALKADDDILVNMFSMLDILSNMIKKDDTKEIIMSRLWKNNKVQRKGKHMTPKAQYNKKVYPTHATGGAYLMSIDVVKNIHELALRDKRTEVFRLEDVYLTGILGDEANITRRGFQNSHYILVGRDVQEFFNSRSSYFLIWHRPQDPSIWQRLFGTYATGR